MFVVRHLHHLGSINQSILYQNALQHVKQTQSSKMYAKSVNTYHITCIFLRVNTNDNQL